MLYVYRFRLYPNKEQMEFLNRQFGYCRFTHNKILETAKREYKEKGKRWNYYKYKKMLPFLKKQYPFLREANSQSLQEAVKQLDKAFKNFFKSKHGFPKFKNRKHINSISVPQHFSIQKRNEKNGLLRIPKLKTPILVRIHREIEGKAKSINIVRTQSGTYFVNILTEREIKPLIPVDKVIGIDVGIKHFAAITTGSKNNIKSYKVSNHKYLMKAEKKLKRMQRQLSRKKHPTKRNDNTKRSNNYQKQVLRIAKLHEKISNKRKDFLHKLSKTIIDENQVIVVEDLNVKGMLKNHHLAKEISSVSWSKFIEMLRYKSEWYGRKLIKADRFYPSSQICSICGYRNPLIKDLSIREWICPVCKTHHNRDENASANLWQIGIDYLKSVGQELPELKPVERDNVDERMATYLKSEPSLKQEASH